MGLAVITAWSDVLPSNKNKFWGIEIENLYFENHTTRGKIILNNISYSFNYYKKLPIDLCIFQMLGYKMRYWIKTTNFLLIKRWCLRFSFILYINQFPCKELHHVRYKIFWNILLMGLYIYKYMHTHYIYIYYSTYQKCHIFFWFSFPQNICT